MKVAICLSEKDILKLVTALISNTKGEGKGNDPFWEKAETLLYTALIGYIHYEAPPEEQNFATMIEFINAFEVREDDEDFQNAIDRMFEKLRRKNPNHFAVRQYAKLNISRVHMANIEIGDKAPSIDLLIVMSEFFGVSLDYLVLGK